MSAHLHTPGPLKASRGWDGDPERWVIVTDGRNAYHIATIENGQPGDSCETEGHTAHLFAASLELLALASHVVAMADDVYLVGHPEWQAIVDEARAAIAKAETEVAP